MPALRRSVLTKTRNVLKRSKTSWNHLMVPEITWWLAKTTKNHPGNSWYYVIPVTVHTKNELFFSCVVLMLCLQVIFVNCLKLIILQTTWNLSQEFDVIMPHMNIVLILCLFLIIVIILSFRQIWFHNVESSKQTVI